MTKYRRKRRVLPAVLITVIIAALLGTAGWFGWGYYQRYTHPLRYESYVEKYSRENGLDKYLVYAVIKTESGFDPGAVSNVGARGLMQIMEDTFDWVKFRLGDEDTRFLDMYDPETNIRFGSYFVSYCLDRYSGHLATAAAAYHSGVGTVDGLLGQEAYSTDGVTLDHYPYPQMRLYVKKITESYQHYSEIYK